MEVDFNELPEIKNGAYALPTAVVGDPAENNTGIEGFQLCVGCHRAGSDNDFPPANHDKPHAYCYSCSSDRQTGADSDDVLTLTITTRRGKPLSIAVPPPRPAIREEFMVQQGGMCAICGTHQNEQPRRLSLDHDHANGMFRGLLCNKCNIMLGAACDNPDVLREGAAYLERTSYEK